MSVCRACGAATVHTVLRQEDVPVNSCLLLEDEREARTFPTGAIDLGACDRCGFVSNLAFEPELIEYSSRYEETQGYSTRFRQFQADLARRWLDTYDLRGRRLIEIGCGKGDFLVEMCAQGAGPSIGIDPSVAPDRVTHAAAERIRWHAAFFDESYGDLDADAVICRHTLEHVPDVDVFLRAIRKAIGDRTDTAVLFEVPDALRVIREGAFWDVYYEHCSYFTAGSLARLFRASGFDVRSLWRAFDDQYLILEAVPAEAGATLAVLPLEEDPTTLQRDLDRFTATVAAQVATWRQRIAEARAEGGHVALWGGGSKAVALLSALAPDATVDVVVDINPHKAGKYLAGSGVEVVAPEDLPSHDPTLVVAMNPIYLDEIAQDLGRLGVDASLAGL